LLLLALVAWPEPSWLKTDFQALLPAGSADSWIKEANRQAASAYEGQLVVLVEGEDVGQARQFLITVGEVLASEGLVSADFNELEAEKWQKLATALYPFRWNLLSAADRLALERDPQAFLESFQRKLYSPLGGPLADKLLSDPLGIYRNYLLAAVPMTASLNAQELPETLQLAVYSITREQRGLGAKSKLYEVYASLKATAAQQGLALYAAGAPLYSAYGVYSAEEEISTIGVVSLMLLVTLQLALLRSLTAIGLTLLSVAAGVVGGIVVTVLITRQLHILTVVFGTTIIGIAVDYGYHYLAHSLLPGWRRGDALSRVFTSLSLGALSSGVAFLALTLMPFPGVRQIGLFMASGLLCSFLTVCLLFPLLYRGPPQGSQLPRIFAGSGIPVRSIGVPLMILLLTIPGWMQLTARDEVREFYGHPPQLSTDQAEIAKRLSATADSRYMLVRGSSPEAVLLAEERLRNAAANTGLGETLELSAISGVVPSIEAQRHNFALIRQLVESGALSQHLDALGIERAYRDEVLDGIPDAFKPLQLTALSENLLPSGQGRFIGCQESECASWVRIAAPGRTDSLVRLAQDTPAVELVDPIANINSLLVDYRQSIVIVMMGGSLLIFVILGLLYGWRRAIRVMSLPVVTCLLTIAAIGYLHGSYTIINLLALMLIIGVSMDYSIFRGFTAPQDQPAVTLAITLSALTSVVAFGMLAFSRTPLISSFGETIALGLGIAYSLSWVRVVK
tara:strand:- start:11245 stop:13455 length:2211 start_codon:yes stop_codon:yes gene_type:complete